MNKDRMGKGLLKNGKKRTGGTMRQHIDPRDIIQKERGKDAGLNGKKCRKPGGAGGRSVDSGAYVVRIPEAKRVKNATRE